MNTRLQRASCIATALAILLAFVTTGSGMVVADANETGPGSTFSGGQSSITAGFGHTCALLHSGAARCWGLNNRGQLGIGSSVDHSLPVDVTGLSGGVSAIAAGGDHTCALLDGGAVKCWGQNTNGQLGDNSTDDRDVPVSIGGSLGTVTAVTAGDAHSCALLATGAVACWGKNSDGQLGDNSQVARLTPVSVTGLTSGVTAVSAGGAHTCAVVSGAAKCWGLNTDGQLGDGSNTSSSVPVQVTGLTSGVAAISAGAGHTCALLLTGAVKCWGQNTDGQLGDGSSTARLSPVQVTGLTSGVSAVTTGGLHSCALLATGAATCWGKNTEGQLGRSRSSGSSTPVAATGLSQGVTAITAGDSHTCALLSGVAKCWGRNVWGQLGNGPDTKSLVPADTFGLSSGVTAISVGDNHACAVVSGAAKCWGFNEWGGLGNTLLGIDLDTKSYVPVQVDGLTSGVTAISAGSAHTCAVVSGAAKCWGANFSGQLGNGTDVSSTTPVQVTGLTSGVTAISTGTSHTCAVVSGAAMCWGQGDNGQLGDGRGMDSTTPVQVDGLTSGVTAISAGSFHACAVVPGAAKCWGLAGPLGDGSGVNYRVPVQVSDITGGATAITTRNFQSCAIVAGAAKCWGNNISGVVGDGSGNFSAPVPVQVSGLTNGVISLTAGTFHTCAALGLGTAKCWGRGEHGRLGDGTDTERILPVDVTGLSGSVASISAGQSHTCALLVTGAVKCWGLDDKGQLGSGPDRSIDQPVSVVGVAEGVGPTTTTSTTTTSPAAATTIPAAATATTTPTTSTTLVATPATPTVTRGKSLSGSALARSARLSVPRGSSISLRVRTSDLSRCRIVKTALRGVRPGSCRVTVTVKPRKGRATARTVTVKVT